MREGFLCEPGGAARLKRRMIERVLTRCEDADLGELAPLLTLLRRFATEAAREEARLFCDELVADDFDDDGIRPRPEPSTQVPRAAGSERRRENVFQIIRPEAVLALEEFVGDFAQPLRQRAGDVGEVGAGMFADDGAHGVDVLVDERDRDARDLRRVLEQPAQAFGDAGDLGIAERRGFAFDVVGGAEQRVVRLLGEA